jgi:hypothetical protein
MTLVGAALIFSIVAMAAPPAGLPGVSAKENVADFSAPPFDREAALRKRAEVHDWLLSQAVKEGLREPLKAFVSDAEKAEIDNARGETPPRVGLSKSVSANVDFRGLRMSGLKGRSLTLANGAIEGTADGGFVYTISLTSPGAAALRLHFTGFHLPPQTGLYLYTDTGEAFGPYTGRGPLGTGQFWSHTVEGDYVILQLHHVGQANDDVLHGSGFTINQVGHLRPRLMAGFCGFNAPCVKNASCGTDSAVTDAKDAVADMLFISGAYYYICTGGLLNDTDTDSTIPHFLTARHCISKGGEAASLETFFQFTTSCGTSSCPDLSSVPQSQRTLGSTITVSKRASDFTLLRLSQAAPEGSAYLGWTSTAVARIDGTDLFRISHPQGAPQAYSEHEVDTTAPTCRGWPRGNWIYSRDTYGTTEGGSSGSPVVNSTGQVVGHLSGGCGYDVRNVCNSVDNATVDGAFAAYFSDVEPYLDPTDGGGCIAVVENCFDGIDNDCDGLIDGDDTDDCSGGGEGAGKGEICLVDGDCTSNKCRGRTGAKTCK